METPSCSPWMTECLSPYVPCPSQGVFVLGTVRETKNVARVGENSASSLFLRILRCIVPWDRRHEKLRLMRLGAIRVQNRWW